MGGERVPAGKEVGEMLDDEKYRVGRGKQRRVWVKR